MNETPPVPILPCKWDSKPLLTFCVYIFEFLSVLFLIMKVPEGSLMSPHVLTQLCTASSGLEVEQTWQGICGYHTTSQEGLDIVATQLQLRAERIRAKNLTDTIRAAFLKLLWANVSQEFIQNNAKSCTGSTKSESPEKKMLKHQYCECAP